MVMFCQKSGAAMATPETLLPTPMCILSFLVCSLKISCCMYYKCIHVHVHSIVHVHVRVHVLSLIHI